VRRSRIVTGKLAAALIAVMAQNIVFYAFAAAWTAMLIDDPMDGGILALLCFSNFLIQLFFVGAGMAIAASLPKIKSVMPITLGMVFFFFIVEMINESLLEKALTYVTPFAYFKGSGILASRAYDWSYLAVDLAVFAGLTAFSYWIYQKKDVHAI
jgi:ABC-2 type transport system permease protein